MNPTEAVSITTAACLGLGRLAKSWPRFPNAYIPTLVAVAGAVLVPALSGWAVLHVITGFIAGLAATGMHTGFREVTEDIKHRRTGNTRFITNPANNHEDKK